MHKYLVVLVSILLASSFCIAQQRDSLPKRKVTETPHEWLVKFNPLSIFDTDGGLNFSGEYILPDLNLGLQLEVQPVLFDTYRNDGDGNGFEAPVGVIQSSSPFGIKLRPELRYYFDGIKLFTPRYSRGNSHYLLDPETRRKLQNRTYLAVDFLYKNIHRQRLNEFNISTGGTQPAYQQKAVYTDVKQVMGWNFKLGFVTPVSGEHWLTDFYIGFGVRYKKWWYRGLPAGASEPARSTIGFPGPNRSNTPASSYPSIPIGVKVVYRF